MVCAWHQWLHGASPALHRGPASDWASSGLLFQREVQARDCLCLWHEESAEQSDTKGHRPQSCLFDSFWLFRTPLKVLYTLLKQVAAAARRDNAMPSEPSAAAKSTRNFLPFNLIQGSMGSGTSSILSTSSPRPLYTKESWSPQGPLRHTVYIRSLGGQFQAFRAKQVLLLHITPCGSLALSPKDGGQSACYASLDWPCFLGPENCKACLRHCKWSHISLAAT